MSSDDGRRCAGEPDTPVSKLLELCATFPDEVLANEALPLLSLEDPASWREIVDGARAALIERSLASRLREAPPTVRRRFAGACLERALDLWQRARPERQLDAQELAALALLQADGSSDAALRARARTLATELRSLGARTGDALTAGVGVTACHVFGRCNEDTSWDAALAAAELAGQAAGPERGRGARVEERAWQMRRLDGLLRRPPTRD